MNKSDSQFEVMTTKPIERLIIKLAIPTIISMLVTSIYNMADTFFVSKIGTSATGAVGIVFSIMTIIQAIGFMFGMGCGSLSSRYLGQRKNDTADMTCSTAFFYAVSLGIIFGLTGIIFLNSILTKLGATPTILPYAKSYARYIFIGAPIMCGSFVLNNILRCQGKAILSMCGLCFGGLLNIALDPIFIFVLKLGISGASIATCLSQLTSFLILLSFFIRKKSIINLRITKISFRLKTLLLIVRTGLPSLLRQGLASMSTVLLNVNAAVYGDAAVAAMSVVGRVFLMVVSAMIGFGQGFQPVVGYNYGAAKYKRVQRAFKFTFLTGFTALFIFGVIGFIFANQIMMRFTKDDAEVIRIGVFAMRAQFCIVPLQALIVCCNMAFQVTGKTTQATFISAFRQGIFFIPLIIILPRVLGLTGVQITQTVSDSLSFLVCIPFALRFYRELGREKTC